MVLLASHLAYKPAGIVIMLPAQAVNDSTAVSQGVFDNYLDHSDQLPFTLEALRRYVWTGMK